MKVILQEDQLDNRLEHLEYKLEPNKEKPMSDQPKVTTGYKTADPVPVASVSSRTNQYDKAVAAAKKIFEEKNAQYGDSITATGVLGASVELVGTSARLRQMVIKDSTHGEAHREAVIDVLKDQINYAVIALMMLSESNWDGK